MAWVFWVAWAWLLKAVCVGVEGKRLLGEPLLSTQESSDILLTFLLPSPLIRVSNRNRVRSHCFPCRGGVSRFLVDRFAAPKGKRWSLWNREASAG